MSVKRRIVVWQQYHADICPAGFGEQLQGVALQRKEDTSN
jgi:hypothetical protein